MRNLLPAEEVRSLIGKQGFLRLHGQDSFLFISDLPRRIPENELAGKLHTLKEHGFTAEAGNGNLLEIDLQPQRWQELLSAVSKAGTVPLPPDESLHGVYALARLLSKHPSEFTEQPMDMIRAVVKRYAAADGMTELAVRLHKRCAEKLRLGQPLPSVLAKVFYAWISEQI